MNAMTISQRLRAQFLVALTQRDWEAIDGLIGDAADELGGEEDAMSYFRAQVLPEASLATREAFWRHAMSPEQFDEFAANIVGAATGRLEAAGLTLGADYSVGPQRVYLTAAARQVLEEHYTLGQMASLSIFLETPNVD
jgi:hypothetical protein